MPEKNKSIPVNAIADNFGTGISIEKTTLKNLYNADYATLAAVEEGKSAHRHDGHSFFLVESGTVEVEIDFHHYTINPSSVIYVHPDQVHRTTISDDFMVSAWAVTNENLNPDYLKLLEDITPAKPLVLNEETYAIMYEAASLCLKFYERRSDKLYYSLLKDSCNALVALVISQYLAQTKSPDKLSRFEIIAKAFRELLEHNYTTSKRPAAYAEKLSISTPYLNECVKNVTGYPVSHQIQQRVILEAKRLLFYSDKSVKEIAALLGYDDYPYFSRLFTKVAGMTAVTFRNKNLG